MDARKTLSWGSMVLHKALDCPRESNDCAWIVEPH